MRKEKCLRITRYGLFFEGVSDGNEIDKLHVSRIRINARSQ